jgi:hypothetical protein
LDRHVATGRVGQVAVGRPYCFGRCRFSYHDNPLNAKKYSPVGIPSAEHDHISTIYDAPFCSGWSFDRVPNLLLYNQDVIICAPSLFSTLALLQSLVFFFFFSTIFVPYAINEVHVTALEIHPSLNLNKVELYILNRW